jgi:ketosteroid isomerase-like protein
MKFWLTIVLCLVAGWSSAQTSDSAAERELLGLERVLKLQACQSKDLKTIDDLLDDSFVLIDPDGKYYSKADVLTFVKSMDVLQFVAEDMTVRLHGNTAIVTGLYQLKTVLHGKASLKKGRFVDTWLLKNGRWKGVASIDVPAQ